MDKNHLSQKASGAISKIVKVDINVIKLVRVAVTNMYKYTY